MLRLFAITWILTEAASLVALRLGVRAAGHPALRRLGEVSHRRKLRSLERVWPLTRIPPALERGDTATCTVILTILILLKSVASLVLGLIMVFWLPLASLIVPSIIAVHASGDEVQARWVQRVGALQVTSHALAAAVGFATTVLGPIAGRGLGLVVSDNAFLIAIACVASLAFALAAGQVEASGLSRMGLGHLAERRSV